MTCEILLLGSDQLSVENSIQFLFHIKHTGITTPKEGLSIHILLIVIVQGMR
jgi:hypothetical protein